MKKLPLLMLSLAALPLYAQSNLSALSQYQSTLQPAQSGSASGSSTSDVKPEVKPSTSTSSSSSKLCDENDQTSLPLSYLTSLILQKDAKIDLLHDPRSGKLTISSADMIGNCASMLEWNLKKPEIQGKKSYAVEVKIKQGADCKPEGCSYKVAKVENGEFKQYEAMTFRPTLKGFEECLQRSGVIAGGKVVPGAIYSTPVKEKFDGLDVSGNLYFLSHGPSTPLVKPKYGKFEYQDGCDYYEAASPDIKRLLTYEDEERERLDAEAEKLKNCTIENYGKLAEFIDKYEGYASILGSVRDNLILEAAKKAAAKIGSGKYSDEDLKVMADFDRYIVQPKVQLARGLYEESLDLEGDSKKAKQDELVKVRTELAQLNQKPYFLAAHTQLLIKDGRFEDAEKLNTMKLTLDNHARLGMKQENVVITTGVASQRIAAGKQQFAESLVKEKERFEIRTGQVTGKSQYYTNLAARMRQNIQLRTQNFNAEIQSEASRLQQPNGYCYKYWRNTQKCIQDSLDRIQELQSIMQHYNNVDEERAKEYDAQAKDYGDLEAQGRRYVATQSGEEAPAEAPAPQNQPKDTTVPTPRPQNPDPGVYTFNYQNGQGQQGNPQMYQQQGQFTPQQYQYPMNPYAGNNMFMQQQNPYGYGGYQQSYMGQQGYGMQPSYGGGYGMGGGYNFNWNGGGQYGGYQQGYGGYQQPYGGYQQQMPYYNNPYQAYGGYGSVGGGYSIYGRTW